MVLKAGPNNLWIELNHPVQEFVWVFQREDFYFHNGNRNYSSIIGIDDFATNVLFLTFIQPLLSDLGGGTSNINTLINKIHKYLQQLLEDNDKDKNNISDNLVNTMQSCQFLFNGKERFSQKDFKFFEYVQSFRHHTGKYKYPGIYSYSFALNPEEFQPSGTCNMSRIDKFEMRFTLKPAYYTEIDPQDITLEIGGVINYNMRFFAVNYNVLRIIGGMGDVAFAS